MHSELPLVSAIMPTRGRQQWAAEAVAMFQRQTYPSKELVIIDDMMEPSFSAAPAGCIYERAGRVPIGAKRNLACSRAEGVIICHWDSDDLYADDRIESQVRQLLESGVDLVGYRALEFVESDGQYRRFEFRSTDTDFCAGVSMMYWRDSWQRHPFDPVDVGEDHTFMMTRSRRGFEHGGRITARIHTGNTADKRAHLTAREWRLIA